MYRVQYTVNLEISSSIDGKGSFLRKIFNTTDHATVRYNACTDFTQ